MEHRKNQSEQDATQSSSMRIARESRITDPRRNSDEESEPLMNIFRDNYLVSRECLEKSDSANCAMRFEFRAIDGFDLSIISCRFTTQVEV